MLPGAGDEGQGGEKEELLTSPLQVEMPEGMLEFLRRGR